MVFFRRYEARSYPSCAPMTQRSVDAIKSSAARNGLEIVSLRRGERKGDRTRQYLRDYTGGGGVLYIGKAQERRRAAGRSERRHYPSKFCRYFPYNAKLCNQRARVLEAAADEAGHRVSSRSRRCCASGWPGGLLLYTAPDRQRGLCYGVSILQADHACQGP